MKKIRLTSNWKSVPNDKILVETIKNSFITKNNYNKNYILTHENDFDYLVILNDFKSDFLKLNINPEKTILYYNEPSWHPYIYETINNNLHIAKYICYHSCDLLNRYVSIKDFNNTFIDVSGILYHWVVDIKKNISLDYLLTQTFKKTKQCSFIVSGKSIGNKRLASHAKESLYLERLYLVKEILDSKLDIDIYGKGLIEIFGNHSKIKGEIPSKLEALKDYNFSIAVENTPEKGYFTEKLTDCILTNTTPIYIGCPNIQDHFANIHSINFENTINKIDKILNENLILDQSHNKNLFNFKYNLYNHIINTIEKYNI